MRLRIDVSKMSSETSYMLAGNRGQRGREPQSLDWEKH